MTTVSSMATTYYWKRPETALVVFQAGGLSHCSSFIPKYDYDLFWMVYVYTKGNHIKYTRRCKPTKLFAQFEHDFLAVYFLKNTSTEQMPKNGYYLSR